LDTFHLSKWYLDCVADDGSAIIGYFARLRWRSLALQYAAALVAPAGLAPRQLHALRSVTAPVLGGGNCTWRCGALQLEGEWTAVDTPVALDLLQTPEGVIRWRLHQPRAEARVRLDGAPGLGAVAIQGLGYVEELELTVPPWQLPFDLLLWGRFLSRSDALVWIRWERAAEPEATRRQFVLWNGSLVQGAAVRPELISVPDSGTWTDLPLGDYRPLREGPLAANVFSAVPGLVSLLPRRFRDACESKRLTRGALGASEGWAIHEVVRW